MTRRSFQIRALLLGGGEVPQQGAALLLEGRTGTGTPDERRGIGAAPPIGLGGRHPAERPWRGRATTAETAEEERRRSASAAGARHLRAVARCLLLLSRSEAVVRGGRRFLTGEAARRPPKTGLAPEPRSAAHALPSRFPPGAVNGLWRNWGKRGRR